MAVCAVWQRCGCKREVVLVEVLLVKVLLDEAVGSRVWSAFS